MNDFKPGRGKNTQYISVGGRNEGKTPSLFLDVFVCPWYQSRLNSSVILIARSHDSCITLCDTNSHFSRGRH